MDELPVGYRSGRRRPGTPEEAHALAHPLRIRILRLALDTPRTNKELAERLGVNPGTTLHHVRLLTRHGFLEAAGERTGRRGAREVPYRATGKSWVVDLRDDTPVGAPIVEASYAEYREADPADRFGETRVALRLTGPDVQELRERVWRLVEEFRTERQRADGDAYALFWAFHRRRDA